MDDWNGVSTNIYNKKIDFLDRSIFTTKNLKKQNKNVPQHNLPGSLLQQQYVPTTNPHSTHTHHLIVLYMVLLINQEGARVGLIY